MIEKFGGVENLIANKIVIVFIDQKFQWAQSRQFDPTGT